MRYFNRYVITACICFVALVHIQCVRDDGGNESENTTLTIHISDQDERVLGPNGAHQWFLVFLGLADDAETMDDPLPRLLERWEHTPDYTEWTLHLRENVRWDDGVPVTAEDVKFSLDLWTNPKIGYEYKWFDTLTVLDNQTLQMTFEEPVSSTIFEFNWLAMLPKHLLDTLDIDDGEIYSWQYWIHPVGNGPYRYLRHIPKTMTELERNPDYYGEPARTQRIVLRYGGNPLIELLSGNVDIASNITASQALTLSADPRFRIYYRTRSRETAIAWNHRNPLFQDADVRRALTMSINRRELLQLLNFPDDIPIFDVPAQLRHHLQGVVPDPLPFSPERAAQLFTRAGWVDTDNDNILEKDGQEFRFSLSTTTQTEPEAVFIQDQLSRLGVRVEISTYDMSLLKERTRGADFDAAICDYNFIEQFDNFRISGYKNSEVSRFRNIAWHTMDPDDNAAAMRALWQIVGAEIPITYLHPSLIYFAANRRVRGIQNYRSVFLDAENLWIEEEEVAKDADPGLPEIDDARSALKMLAGLRE